jgi:ABC-type sugar transport system substrate-binding protein
VAAAVAAAVAVAAVAATAAAAAGKQLPTACLFFSPPGHPTFTAGGCIEGFRAALGCAALVILVVTILHSSFHEKKNILEALCMIGGRFFDCTSRKSRLPKS